jgi:NTE family protein
MQKIGLALSGGGANGFTHIGALIALENAGIKIYAIAGCSMGSIIGALYASGKTPSEIEHFVLSHKVLDLFDISISKLGIAKTNKLRDALNDFMGVTRFEQLKIPLYVNATDLTQGKEMVFSSGEIFSAIRASMAIPGLFSPQVSKDKDIYVDGGVLDNIPFHILPKYIKKYIIIDAMDYKPLAKNKKYNLAKILENSGRLAIEVMLRLRLNNIPKNDYVLIKPKIPDYRIIPGKEKTFEIIKNGELATREKIPEIKKKLLH